MAILSLGQAAVAAIRESYAPGFIDAIYRNNSLLGLFPAPVMSPGDSAYKWKLASAGTAVEDFTEFQPLLNAQTQTYVNASITYPYVRGKVHTSGMARDALRSNWIDSIAEDMLGVRADMVDLITTNMMSNGTYGLEAAVDSTTTYAGISRGSAAYFESSETAVDGALNVSNLYDLQETIRDNDKGGNPSLILLPLNQETNLYRLTGQPFTAMAGPADKAAGLYQQTFAGMRVVALPDWTNTVIMMLDMTPGKFVQVIQRDWTVTEMPVEGDSAGIYQISYSLLLVNKNPKLDGKLTSVTA